MLDPAKVARALENAVDTLFLDISDELALARQTWAISAADPLFKKKVEMATLPWAVPAWDGYLDAMTSIKPLGEPYAVLAVDGSQVYPDKHQGTSCFLINIGTVFLPYRGLVAQTVFSSEPYVFSGQSTLFEGEANILDVVNCKREEFELQAAVEFFKDLALKNLCKNTVFLFDGSLIFWHLESKEQSVKEYFLRSYCSLLSQLREYNVPMAGYISLPKSKELVTLVRAALCNFNPLNKAFEKISHINDAHIVSSFLSQGQRTLLFKSQSPITYYYPEEIRPYFFYLNGGAEIVRVEVPAYVAHNPMLLETVCAVIMDQIEKGRGYPVVLAEAHEQAVIKGPDREMFYRLLEKFSIQARRHVTLSQKAAKKKHVTV